MSNNTNTTIDYEALRNPPLFPLKMSEYGTPKFPIGSWELYKHSIGYRNTDTVEDDQIRWIRQVIEDLLLEEDIDYYVDYYEDEGYGIYLTPWAGLRVISTFSEVYANEAARQMALIHSLDSSWAIPLPQHIKEPPAETKSLLAEFALLDVYPYGILRKSREKEKLSTELGDECRKQREELRNIAATATSADWQKQITNLKFLEDYAGKAEKNNLDYEKLTTEAERFMMARWNAIQETPEFQAALEQGLVVS